MNEPDDNELGINLDEYFKNSEFLRQLKSDDNSELRDLLNRICVVYPSIREKLFERFPYLNKKPTEDNDTLSTATNACVISSHELLFQKFGMKVKKGYYLPVANTYLTEQQVYQLEGDTTMDAFLDAIGSDLVYELRDNPDQTINEEVEKRREEAQKIQHSYNIWFHNRMITRGHIRGAGPEDLLEDNDIPDEEVRKTMPPQMTAIGPNT